MAKFLLGAFAATLAATAMMATSAQAIENDEQCSMEGGTMVNVKGSDFCLVPIRPEAYRDEIYDGNQLGVTDCPGDKLNDGLYCMYPVTVREEEAATPDVVDSVTDAVKDMAEDAAEDAAKDKVKDAVTGLIE